MYSALCHSGNLDALGGFGVWSLIGTILELAIWTGLLAGLAVLVVLAVRRARVSAAAVSYTSGGPTARETLQARYARGEITREQYERMKQDIG